jgi:hypothetical protein
MHLLVNPQTDPADVECDILLPSNKEWRMKNYYRLVEEQRAMDGNQ